MSDAVPASKLDRLQQALESALGDRVRTLVRDVGELTLTVRPDDYLGVAQTLRDSAELRFEQLIDLCGVDYSSFRDVEWDGPRFCIVTHLLSLTHNWRVRLKVFCADDDMPTIPSVTELWSAANWFEREAFDLYGVIFDGHVDLRRILTDYGFIGHPFRKDFPVTGYTEMRYDPEQKRVIYQPLSIVPREITPRVIREDKYGGLQ